MMPFNDSGVGKFSRLRFKDLSGWLSKLENVYKLGGEICARPLVQERVEKATRRVVTEDCSLDCACGVHHPRAFPQLWTQATMRELQSVTTSVSG